MQKKIKAALFDLDGTLIDTEDQYSEIWGSIGRQYKPDIEHFEMIIKGTTLTNILGTYFHDAALQEKIKGMLDDFESRMDYSFYPGTTEFLDDLRSNGVKCCIVTSSDKKKMGHAMRNNPGIAQFDRILTAEDFAASKPDPDCYLRAAAAMGCQLDECVVFEDAFTGLQAGMSSGITTIGLATCNPREAIQDRCHAVIDNFQGFTLSKLQDIIDAL